MDSARVARGEEPEGSRTMSSPSVTNAMTVDVEDYFQVSAFEGVIPRKDWDVIPCRVEENVDRILDLFSRYDVKGTFFTLGWIAQRYPALIHKIVGEGHELASHGWDHTRVIHQNAEDFRKDVRTTKHLLEDISGVCVKGYRAASYSINQTNLWALDELADAGYQYSSSIVPVKHDLYGMPDASRFPFRTAGKQFLEIPISTVPIAGRNVNCGGGGWFRLFPYAFSRWAINSINENESEACIFYFHPWEIDHSQPRVNGISSKTRFRHYLNLGKTYDRIERLLNDFQWSRMDKIFLNSEANEQSTQEVVPCL